MSNDCYHRALPDEPKFTLLARDPDFHWRVTEWANRREYDISVGDRPQSDKALVTEARELADRARVWRRKNMGKWRQA